MKKLSVEEVESYWEHRIKRARGSWEGVLWEGLPIWNRYIDRLEIHYLKRYIEQIKSSDSVLDLGCGVGRFTFRFANICEQVWGIDTSATAIKICGDKNIPNAGFKVMDARNLEFDDATFDWVFSITSLQHITSETGLIASIKEILRVTKNTGRIIFLERATDKGKNPYVISLPRSKWFEIIKNSGGKIQSWYGVDVPFLRRIGFLSFGLARKVKISRIRKCVEYGVTAALLPFEYTVPKFLRSQSWYIVVAITN